MSKEQSIGKDFNEMIEEITQLVSTTVNDAENIAKYWAQFEPSMAKVHIATTIDILCYHCYKMSKEEAEKFRNDIFKMMKEAHDNFNM